MTEETPEKKKITWRTFNNPYWCELLSVLLLAAIGIFFDVSYAPQLLVSLLTTLLLDLAINRVRGRTFYLSKSAAISGLLIGSILHSVPLYIFVFAGAAAIFSKHLVTIKNSTAFNPAAVGILLSVLLFSVSDTWWSSGQKIPVIILGLLVAWKISKLRLSLSFLMASFILAFLWALPFQGLTPANLQSSFNSLPLFLAFFMLTEPKTTPFRKQHFWGPLFALAVFALSLGGFPSAWLGGLLLGNLLYALHKVLAFPLKKPGGVRHKGGQT